MGLRLHQLTPAPTSLYRFTGDSLTSIGSIKLAMIVSTYPRVTTVMAKFLVVDCPLTFNAVLERPALKEVQVVTYIHHLIMKFPMLNGISQVCECQLEPIECYNRSLRIAEKTLVVIDQRLTNSGPMSKDLDP